MWNWGKTWGWESCGLITSNKAYEGLMEGEGGCFVSLPYPISALWKSLMLPSSLAYPALISTFSFFPTSPSFPGWEKTPRKANITSDQNPCVHLGIIKVMNVLRAFSLEACGSWCPALCSLWELLTLPTSGPPIAKGPETMRAREDEPPQGLIQDEA